MIQEGNNPKGMFLYGLNSAEAGVQSQQGLSKKPGQGGTSLNCPTRDCITYSVTPSPIAWVSPKDINLFPTPTFELSREEAPMILKKNSGRG